MILLDTHIWVWWVDGSSRLSERQSQFIQAHESTGLGISVISCWEVAKLVEMGRLQLTVPLLDWMDKAVRYPGVQVFALTPAIAIESTQLPPTFHRDPADQIIVATARQHTLSLLTSDARILAYPHVTLLT